MINIQDIEGFEWDEGNRQKSYVKHGITNKEAEEVVENIPLIMMKIKYMNKDRYQAFGKSKSGKLLTIIYTLRKKMVRIISTRLKSKKKGFFIMVNSKKKKLKPIPAF